MKIQVNNSIIETDDIREITTVKDRSEFVSTPNGGKSMPYYGFIIKFYDNKGKDIIVKDYNECWKEDPSAFLANYEKLLEIWSQNRFIPKIIF